MKTIMSLLVVFVVLASCAKRPASYLKDDEPIVEEETMSQTIVLDGFIAGGAYRDRREDAYQSANGACTQLIRELMDTFEHFRFVNDSAYDLCRNPENETTFRGGYLYVFRPTLEFLPNPEDVITIQAGPDITSDEAMPHSYYDAYLSLNNACIEALKAAKERLGDALIVGDCGHAERSVRNVYSEDHRRELPAISLKSQVRFYMRQGVEPSTPRRYELEGRELVPIYSEAQAIAASGANEGEVVISTFAGSLTKVNIETGRKLWEKNLTNPEPTSVRQTTSLDAMAISSGSEWIAVAGGYGYLAIVDGNSGQKIRILSCSPQMFGPKQYEALSFSEDRRSLLAIALNSRYPLPNKNYNNIRFGDPQTSPPKTHTIENWNTETGTLNWTRDIEAQIVLEIAYSADQNFIYLVSSDRVAVIAATDGQLVREYLLTSLEGSIPTSFISGASFSDDMQTLAISAFSGVMLVDTQSGRLTKRLRVSLEFELGKPEIMEEENKIRAFDAWGSVFTWDITSGKLLSIGKAAYSLAYNGPPQMPILSVANGKYLLQTESNFSFGSSISIPRIDPAETFEKLCQAGPDSDLPDLAIRSSAKLMLWSSQP